VFCLECGVIPIGCIPLWASRMRHSQRSQIALRRQVGAKMPAMGGDFHLRFDAGEIGDWASRYKYPGESVIEDEIGAYAKKNGHLTKEYLLRICQWKSPRTHKRCLANDEDFIRAVTSTAFSTASERLRIEVLTLLAGVGWPTASVILHFCSNERYPILDFRALWSLGVEVPKAYDFEFWWAYTEFCRWLADEAGVTMRTLDRALWQFSKEKQAPGPAKHEPEALEPA